MSCSNFRYLAKQEQGRVYYIKTLIDFNLVNITSHENYIG